MGIDFTHIPPSHFRSTEMSDEKLLVRNLMKHYKSVGQIGRPVRNTSQPITVEFGLGLIKMDIMEKENMMTMSAWTRYVS